MTRDDIATLMLALSGAYPNTEVTDETVHLWANTFSHDDPDVIAEATMEWIDTEQFWPTPAGIREKRRMLRRQHAVEVSPAPHWREDPTDPIVDWDTGRQIAWDAHKADRERIGEPPMDKTTFLRMLGGKP